MVLLPFGILEDDGHRAQDSMDQADKLQTPVVCKDASL